MPPERFPPNDPREWLNRATSDLALAGIEPEVENIYLEDLCFHAQQAAEKALKAILLAEGVDFPLTHNIAQLLNLIADCGLKIPAELDDADVLNEYAVTGRYPGVDAPVNRTEWQEAVELASHVVTWANIIINGELHETE